VTARWTFGADPLPQAVRAAALLRRMTALVGALEQEDEAVEQMLVDLERAEAALRQVVPADQTPRVGEAAAGSGRVYVDHAFSIGAHNPCFPEYEIVVDDETAAHGTVTFPLAYEGPPGVVHGGFLAVFFDCVVQHHNCEVGVAGKTVSLALRYHRPTPLVSALEFTLSRSVTGDRIRTTGALRSAATVVCEAEVDAIAGVRSELPFVSPRRTERT
jgi:hypothetical protein